MSQVVQSIAKCQRSRSAVHLKARLHSAREHPTYRQPRWHNPKPDFGVALHVGPGPYGYVAYKPGVIDSNAYPE
jgi:hypothetical protein